MNRRTLLCLDTPDADLIASPVALDLSRRLRDDPKTRRWFLKRGMALGAILALSIFPNFPASAVATTRMVSDTGNNGTALTWATAKTTVNACLAISAAGDIVVVDSAHGFLANAAITWTPPAGSVAVIAVVVSGGAGYTALATTPGTASGCSELCGTTASAFSIAGAAGSSMFVYGIGLTTGTSSGSSLIFFSTNTVSRLEMVNCYFTLAAAFTTCTAKLGQAVIATPKQGTIILTGCTFDTNGTSRAGNALVLGTARVQLINPVFKFTGATNPAILIAASTVNETGALTIQDGDISGYAVASGAYFDAATIGAGCQVILKNLKISATPTLTTGTWPVGNGSITLRNVDSGNTNYIFSYYSYTGTLTADITEYKNSGVAFAGQNVSWKIVTNANCSINQPFATPLLAIWDATTTSESPTISVAQANGATNLNDQTAWMTLDSAASASATNYNFANSRNAQQQAGTPVDWTADSGATWTGLSSPVKQLLSVPAVTPARAGLIQGQVFIAGATLTVYVNAGIDGIT